LTSGDYLLGKLGMIAGVIVVMWTGPLLFGWLLSVGLAPNRDFIVYSLEPLGRALLFNLIGLVSLASIALGVSAVSRTSRNTVILWIGLWLILGAVAKPPASPAWLKRASFTQSLDEARQGILRIDTALATAAESLPLLDAEFSRNLGKAGQLAQPNDL